MLFREIRTKLPNRALGCCAMHGAALSDLATLSVARANYALAFGLAGPGLTPCHIRAGAGLTPCHIRAGAGLTPPTSAPGLPRRFAFRRVQVLVANKMDLESDRRVALEQVWAFGLG